MQGQTVNKARTDVEAHAS